jgi:hypothetical protein
MVVGAVETDDVRVCFFLPCFLHAAAFLSGPFRARLAC